MDVGLLAGDVNRNWQLTDSHGERHLLTLFHDTVTGARAAMLDYEVLMETETLCTASSAGSVRVVHLSQNYGPFLVRVHYECLAMVSMGRSQSHALGGVLHTAPFSWSTDATPWKWLKSETKLNVRCCERDERRRRRSKLNDSQFSNEVRQAPEVWQSKEIPGSAGTTNVFNLVSGQMEILFAIEGTGDSGKLRITRRGLAGFSYKCELNGRLVPDTTSTVQNSEYEFEVSIPSTVDVGSRIRSVTWYEVHTLRRSDNKGNKVESLMKGHHLRSSLPRFPGKKSKLWTNHGDMVFVEDRRKTLEHYMKALLQLPHVSTLDSTRAFLGLVANLREFSLVWEAKELGIALKSAAGVVGSGVRDGGGMPVPAERGSPVVSAIPDKRKSPPGVSVGDRLSKVNGQSTELMTQQIARSTLKSASRPVMLHFLGSVRADSAEEVPVPDAILRETSSTGNAEADKEAMPASKPRWESEAGRSGSATIERIRDRNLLAGLNGTSSSTTDSALRRTVGPFGNGSGAAGRPLSMNGLFGAEQDGTDGIDGQERRPAGVQSRSSASSLETSSLLGDIPQGRAGSSYRGTSDWAPVLQISASERPFGAGYDPGQPQQQQAAFGRVESSVPGRSISFPDDSDLGSRFDSPYVYNHNLLGTAERSPEFGHPLAALGPAPASWGPFGSYGEGLLRHGDGQFSETRGGAAGVDGGDQAAFSASRLIFPGSSGFLPREESRPLAQHKGFGTSADYLGDSSDGEQENPFA